jgi:hypothetical protein
MTIEQLIGLCEKRLNEAVRRKDHDTVFQCEQELDDLVERMQNGEE